MIKNEICLLNDSFPPIIDGVANAVVNYAKIIRQQGGTVSVIAPEYPGADDSCFDYPVIRYKSIDFRRFTGYTAGIPFALEPLKRLSEHKPALLHSHCPIASTALARRMRESLKLPLVMTYHTKYDIDISNALHGKLLQEGALQLIMDNINACDELWTVSAGAGENLKKIGYAGDYIVMENGVDIPRGRLPREQYMKLSSELPPDELPLLLFVGRLMWYKGIRLILDALAALRSQDYDFNMIFIGGGSDAEEIKKYARELRLDGSCRFIGPVYDREILRAWYCRADLFLFPSCFDTNGLVVREAAACSLPCVLVKGSCAAEGVKAGENGFLIEENAASLALCIAKIMNNRQLLRSVGEAASRELYISWEDAVAKAVDRYETVIDNYASGKYAKRRRMSDEFIRLEAELKDAYLSAVDYKNEFKSFMDRYL